MGIFSFRKGRKSPAQSTLPERLEVDIQHSTLLDRFSLEVGSPRSASGWSMPDSILSPASPLWQIHNNNGFGDSPLRLRGGEMQDFQDCDPNSPTSLARYLSWIDQDYYDEQFALRNSEITQRIVQQTEQNSHGEFVSPYMDDPDSDSETDGGCLLSTPPSKSYGPYHHLDLEEHNDVAAATSPSNGDWLLNTTFHNSNKSSETFTIDDDEDCEYDADIESVWSINNSTLLGSDLPDMLDLPGYEEFEAAKCRCYDNVSDNTADSQPAVQNSLDLEVAEDWECISYDGLPESPIASEVSEADFWAISEELRYLISRFHGFFDTPFISESKHESVAENEMALEMQQQRPFPPFPTAAFHPSGFPIKDIQAQRGLLQDAMRFSQDITVHETRDISSDPLHFGHGFIDSFIFSFEHNGPRYPLGGCPCRF